MRPFKITQLAPEVSIGNADGKLADFLKLLFDLSVEVGLVLVVVR